MLKTLAVALYLLQALCAVQLVMAQQPQPVVVLLPCGVETEYNALTVLDNMQLIIRNCTGSRVDVNGVQFIGTYLSLNFRSPLTPTPKNITVLLENSVSVDVHIIGGNGSSPSALISGFTIIMIIRHSHCSAIVSVIVPACTGRSAQPRLSRFC